MAHSRTAHRPRATWLAIAVAVLIAEVFTFTHSLDADGHASGEPCKICLSLGGHSAANVSRSPLLDIPGRAPRPAIEATLPWVSVDRVPSRARDPPTFS